MKNYNKVKACFEENKCTLLTTYEEFEERRKHVRINYYQYVRVDFIGHCSHKSSVVFTNFYLRKTGINCKDCVKKNTQDVLKDTNKHANVIESDGIKIIEEYLSEQFQIQRTKEGCRADLAIKLGTEEKDEWIPVQVKTTVKNSHGMYSFGLNDTDYTNMLLICVCNEEQKVWIIPYNNLCVKRKFNISVKSKYNRYLVDKSNVYDTIKSYMDKIVLSELKLLMTPLSYLQQREQLYVQKREQFISYLIYEYSDIQGTRVDFKINGKKIQEKVLGLNKEKKTLYIDLKHNNGKCNGKRQFKSYCLGDNNYYWLHSSIDNRFWIIPEQVLFEKGYISDQNEIVVKRPISFKPNYTENSIWLKEYEYDYEKVNHEKIREIFG